MTIALGDITKHVRLANPAFRRANVPDVVLLHGLSQVQRDLIAEAASDQLVVANANVMFDLTGANGPGAGGYVSAAAGLPAELVSGVLKGLERGSGRVVGLDIDNATVLHEGVVTSAENDPGTGRGALTQTGAGWTTNEWAGKLIVITHGPGAGEVHTINDNDTDTLHLANYTLTNDPTYRETWITVPTAESAFEIRDFPTQLVDGTAGMVFALPALAKRNLYYVETAADGTHVIDLMLPLVAQYDVGITLPDHVKVLGGTIRYTNDTSGSAPVSNPTTDPYYPGRVPGRSFRLVNYHQRWNPPYFPSGYMLGNELYLCGTAGDWTDVYSIDLRYIPLPPDLTGLATTFLLPDLAKGVLYAEADMIAAMYVASNPTLGIPVDLNFYEGRRVQARADFNRLIKTRQKTQLLGQKRNR